MKNILLISLLSLASTQTFALDLGEALGKASDAKQTADAAENLPAKSLTDKAKDAAVEGAKGGAKGAVEGVKSGQITDKASEGAIEGAKSGFNF